MLRAALSSRERSYDIPLVSTRQPINISDPIGYFGFFILNCAGKSYTMDLSINMQPFHKNARLDLKTCDHHGTIVPMSIRGKVSKKRTGICIKKHYRTSVTFFSEVCY
jgi:hypothetical protein